MRLGLKLLAASAAVFASTSANAALVTGQISVGGYASPTGSGTWSGATGYDAVANGGNLTLTPGVAGGLTSYGAGTGSFTGLVCAQTNGSCGTLADILNFATFSPITNFLTLNVNGISFDLNSITGITRTSGGDGGSLTLTGTGLIHFNGFENTAGLFSLTAQGTSITSFSASAMAAPVPEPATWGLMLLGFGAVGGAMRYRRRSTKVSFA